MIHLRRWTAAGFLGVACFLAAACSDKSGNTAATPNSSGGSAGPVDVGADLYTAAPRPKSEPTKPLPEPIVVSNAVVQSDIRVQVAAQVDGMIELIASPLEAGAKTDPNDPDIVYHPRDTKRAQPYRRLRENDLVRADQILARQDEQLVALEFENKQVLVQATKEAIKAAKQAEDKQQETLEITRKLTSSSRAEILSQESLLARYLENRLQSEKELAKVGGEVNTARAQLARYWVKSPINGRVIRLIKSPQEYAKAGEVVMEIQATDRVRVEGKMDIQYVNLIRPRMKVAVEPARPVGPSPMAAYHRMEVAAVAVTAHKGRPMIVSGGLDGNALVWDVYGNQQATRLPHPVGVRAVACTCDPKSKTQLVATGGEDGKVRLWDVSNPDKLPKEPLTPAFEDAHGAAVSAAAFSPDGKFLATAAGRDVYVWNVADKKRLYALPAEHRDAVTTVRFTPQCTLVTGSRDRSIRVWKLGTAGAAVQSVIDHRGGGVDVLGVSADGTKVLFDKDPGRLDVVNLADERSVGTLQNAGGAGARFATLALFSADDKYVLTGGGDAEQRGELTVWEAPQPGGRGAERMRLLTPKGAAVTCAAFSPDGDKSFIAVGTAEGGVHFWTQAAIAERGRSITGEVVSWLPADARSVTVRVEMPNPTGKYGEGLQDRSLATIIINPADADAAPPAPVVPVIPPPAEKKAGTAIRPADAVGVAGGGLVQAGAVGDPTAPMPPMAPAVSSPTAVRPPASATGFLTLPPVAAPPVDGPKPVAYPK